MPVPPSLPHVSTMSSVGSSTVSSSSTQNPSLVHRLLESAPEHAVRLIEKLFAPNTLQYTLPCNDPHNSAPSSPTVVEQVDNIYKQGARVWGRRKSSIASKGKEVSNGLLEV